MSSSGLVTECGLAPRSNRSGTADRRLTFTTAVGVIVGVHDGTANGGTEAHVTGATRFTELDVYGIDVADLTDGCFAAEGNESNFTAGKTNLCVLCFLCKKLSRVARAADKLCALAGKQFDAVDHRADGDVFERKRIADFDVACFAGNDGFADLKAVRSNDVTLFAVFILNQSDESTSVRIVLDCFNCCRDSIFSSLEVDDSVFSSASATLMSYSDFTLIVTSGVLLKGSNEGFLWFCSCNLREVGTSHMSS